MVPDFERRQVAVFLDVDGTLIDIASRPDQVIVPPSLVDALRRLDGALDGALALVSGRTIADIDHLFRPLQLRASGVHGAEVRFHPDDRVVMAPGVALPEDIVAATRQLAAAFEGTLIEDKRFSVAVHYRQNPGAGLPLRRSLDDLVAAHPDDGLRILPGHMVFEIKRATFDKGTAIGRLMEQAPFVGRKPIFLGDDITDRPGFETVMRKGGFAFSVGQSMPGLTGFFADPAAVRDWLAGWAISETSHV